MLLALTQPAPFFLCADMLSVLLDTAPKSLLPTPGGVRYVEAYLPSMNWILQHVQKRQYSNNSHESYP